MDITESEAAYLKRRAAEEKQYAEAADSAANAAIHLRLAALYEDRAASVIDSPSPIGMSENQFQV